MTWRGLRRSLAGGAGVFILVSVAPPPQAGSAVVAADHVLASEAGVEILAAGGNATDAAVAAALSAGVVQPAGSGLGGGGFAVGVLGSEVRFALDFRETAPAAATRDMFVRDGQVDARLSREGGLAIAVPGEPRGLAMLVREHGRLSLLQVAGPAIRQATRGFEVGDHLARSLEATLFPSVRRVFARGDSVARTGDVVRRRDLAAALRLWARSGGNGLNEGRGASSIAATVRAAGGVITTDDLRKYAPTGREPLVGRYHGFTIVTMPPPSSGGVAILQLLSVLEGWDVTSLGHNSSDYVHLLAEAMKHVYADRAHHLGDPDFVEVPVQRLLSPERTSEIQRAIWPSRTFGPEHYGERIEIPDDAGTQHISVIDSDGFGVALTTTINTSFGSGVMVEGLGLLLNNEMDDFAGAPGVPNAYGLVGTEANAVAPGKRPLSSMTPTVVLDESGNVVLVVGASGGSTIISATLQVLLAVLDFGLDPQEAVSAPRMHHQWLPDVLWLEPGYPDDVVRAVKARGHEVTVRPGFSSVQIVYARDGHIEGGSDPRKGGWPASAR